MRRHSRVGTMLDVGRLAEGLSRPGSDPRVWTSLAVVEKFYMDPVHGPFADVMLMPGQQRDTARVGAIYAGPGYGVWAPVHADDEVLVEAPSGDPAEGLVIIQRLWSRSDPPPAEACAFSNDLIIVVEKGKNLRLLTSGGGKVFQGAAKSSTHANVLGDVLKDALTELVSGAVLQSPVGPVFAKPDWIQKYLTEATTNILSQTTFTERSEDGDESQPAQGDNQGPVGSV